MTTIVVDYENRVIAWDSRRTQGGVIKSDSAQKMQERDGVKFFISGSLDEVDYLIDNYSKGIDAEVPDGYDVGGFVLDSGVLYRAGMTNQTGFWKQLVECNDSTGSGDQWALAALDHGKSAKEAVEYAKTRDCYTGGEVHTLEF